MKERETERRPRGERRAARRAPMAFLLAAFLSAAGGGLGAEDRRGEFSASFLGPRLNLLLLDGFPLPAGADVELDYRFAGSALPSGGRDDVVARLGAGYSSDLRLRDPLSGDPVAESGPVEGLNAYNVAGASWDIGLEKAIAARGEGNLLEAFAYWRGRLESYESGIPEATFADARGVFSNALLVGLGFDGVETDARGMKRGVSGEASVEWAPGLWAGRGGSPDFARLALSVEAYAGLFSLRSGRGEALSAYFSTRAAFDAAAGDGIPSYVLQSLGGREPIDGLGDGALRGYPWGSYDAAVKAVHSSELRLLGPSLFGEAGTVPLLYCYLDWGYYSGLPDSANFRKASGLLASTGLGFALKLGDPIALGIRLDQALPGNDRLYELYRPDGETLTLAFSFALHF